MLDDVTDLAWPVRPGAETALSRPVMILSSLLALGHLPRLQRLHYHGRLAKTGEHEQFGIESTRLSLLQLLRGSRLRDNPAIYLSPLVPLETIGTAIWADFYDDWSLAPEMPPWLRAQAARNYRNPNASRAQFITVNTRYMQYRLDNVESRVLPNGVDPQVANIALKGDAKRRLIILGAFRRKRTDYHLLQRLGQSHPEEVVVAGPGAEKVSAILKGHSRGLVKVYNHLTLAQVAEFVGPNTVAAIPNRVSDFTLSQDSMKLYQYLGLGLPVLYPRALWPPHVDHSRGFLMEAGVDETQEIWDWARALGECTYEWRSRFVGQHSWQSRAASAVRLLRRDPADAK